ncbi:glycosyltransferase [Arenibacter certesii]|uniref:Glycosyl transferase n=1 Tax=Arenibacter certesii TaxID=228955 RepID=A0A918J299_9FLAO|nr:glycosyltransferase [Arenibacter certesii]GGW44177.1 glycosyl transferase [Arenibacter certesii]
MKKKLLIIGYIWPEPNTTAAGGRMLQLIHFFLERGYKVTFASTAVESEYSYNLEQLGVRKSTIQLNHSSFDVFIKELDPTVVLFDRFLTEEQFGWKVAEQLPNALRILDTEDLHSLRTARQEAYKRNQPFTIEGWLEMDITKREIASIYRSDLSLIISLFEMELLEKTLKINNDILLHLPMMYKAIDSNERKTWLSFDEKSDFVCVGNGKHAPNIDAVKKLKKEIWPLIYKKLPKCNLRIYGAYLPNSVTQLHNPKEGFYIMGHAIDSSEVISRSRLNLAPISFGAGIKGKLLEGMLCGTPSITTDIGAEGICNAMPWNGGIANDLQTFANVAIALYENESEWEKARENGVSIINSIYDKEALQERFLLKIREIHQSLKKHREQNFVGSMLLHHSFASTKYLSKWIAEKNKND